MSQGFNTVIYPVDDLKKAKSVFTALLGTEPYADEAYYVGYRVGDQEIGLDPNGHGKGMTGPVPYRDVDDVSVAVAALVEAGAEVRDEPKDVGGGALIAVVALGGSPIGLRQR